MSYQLLRNFWRSNRGDNFLVDPYRDDFAHSEGYSYSSDEGYYSETQVSGTIPLLLFYNKIRGDYFSVATPIGIKSAIDTDYTFIGIQGYIWKNKTDGIMRPLKLFWNIDRADNFTCASEKAIRDAEKTSYKFIRIEGYILSAIPI